MRFGGVFDSSRSVQFWLIFKEKLATLFLFTLRWMKRHALGVSQLFISLLFLFFFIPTNIVWFEVRPEVQKVSHFSCQCCLPFSVSLMAYQRNKETGSNTANRILR